MEQRDLVRHILVFGTVCVGTSVLDVTFSYVRSQPPVPNLRELWTDPIWWFVLVFTYYVVTRMANKRANPSGETAEQP